MTILIVDGPRGGGKSTLCKMVFDKLRAKEQPASLFKHTRPEDPFADMHVALMQFQQQKDTIHICDRFVLTEYVMSMAHSRMRPKLLDKRTRTVEDRLQELDAKHIVLMADVHIIEGRLILRPEDRRWDMPKEAIVPLWNAALGISKTAELMYNNCQQDLEDNSDYLVRWLMAHLPKDQPKVTILDGITTSSAINPSSHQSDN